MQTMLVVETVGQNNLVDSINKAFESPFAKSKNDAEIIKFLQSAYQKYGQKLLITSTESSDNHKKNDSINSQSYDEALDSLEDTQIKFNEIIFSTNCILRDLINPHLNITLNITFKQKLYSFNLRTLLKELELESKNLNEKTNILLLDFLAAEIAKDCDLVESDIVGLKNELLIWILSYRQNNVSPMKAIFSNYLQASEEIRWTGYCFDSLNQDILIHFNLDAHKGEVNSIEKDFELKAFVSSYPCALSFSDVVVKTKIALPEGKIISFSTNNDFIKQLIEKSCLTGLYGLDIKNDFHRLFLDIILHNNNENTSILKRNENFANINNYEHYFNSIKLALEEQINKIKNNNIKNTLIRHLELLGQNKISIKAKIRGYADLFHMVFYSQRQDDILNNYLYKLLEKIYFNDFLSEFNFDLYEKRRKLALKICSFKSFFSIKKLRNFLFDKNISARFFNVEDFENCFLKLLLCSFDKKSLFDIENELESIMDFFNKNYEFIINKFEELKKISCCNKENIIYALYFDFNKKSGENNYFFKLIEFAVFDRIKYFFKKIDKKIDENKFLKNKFNINFLADQFFQEINNFLLKNDISNFLVQVGSLENFYEQKIISIQNKIEELNKIENIAEQDYFFELMLFCVHSENSLTNNTYSSLNESSFIHYNQKVYSNIDQFLNKIKNHVDEECYNNLVNHVGECENLKVTNQLDLINQYSCYRISCLVESQKDFIKTSTGKKYYDFVVNLFFKNREPFFNIKNFQPRKSIALLLEKFLKKINKLDSLIKKNEYLEPFFDIELLKNNLIDEFNMNINFDEEITYNIAEEILNKINYKISLLTKFVRNYNFSSALIYNVYPPIGFDSFNMTLHKKSLIDLSDESLEVLNQKNWFLAKFFGFDTLSKSNVFKNLFVFDIDAVIKGKKYGLMFLNILFFPVKLVSNVLQMALTPISNTIKLITELLPLAGQIFFNLKAKEWKSESNAEINKPVLKNNSNFKIQAAKIASTVCYGIHVVGRTLTSPIASLKAMNEFVNRKGRLWHPVARIFVKGFLGGASLFLSLLPYYFIPLLLFLKVHVLSSVVAKTTSEICSWLAHTKHGAQLVAFFKNFIKLVGKGFGTFLQHMGLVSNNMVAEVAPVLAVGAAAKTVSSNVVDYVNGFLWENIRISKELNKFENTIERGRITKSTENLPGLVESARRENDEKFSKSY